MTMTRASLVLSVVLAIIAAPQANGAAGKLDRTFGGDGKVRIDRTPDDRFADVATQPDGKVVALLNTRTHRRYGALVVRLRENGRFDRRFGKDGVQRIRLAGVERGRALVLQPDGRILAAFTSNPQLVSDPELGSSFGVARFRRNGRPDRTFDGDGIQTAKFEPGLSDASVSDIAVGPGNDVVVVGRATDFGGSYIDFAVARFEADGALDSDFSGDGRQTTAFSGESTDLALGVAIDSPGRIVAVGTSKFLACCGQRLVMARYTTDGELDPTFSEDGRLISDLGPIGHDVVTLPDDRIAVTGFGSGDLLVARLTETGAPDLTFSGDGAEAVDFSGGPDKGYGMVLAGRKLLVAGFTRGRGGKDFAIARLTHDGTLDNRFSVDGRRVVDFAATADIAEAVAIDPAGNVVAAGVVRGRGNRNHGNDAGAIRLTGGR